jgi:poly(A) polymerase
MTLYELRYILKSAIAGTPFEHITYFAGGCVRDSLLKRETTDFDLAVELEEGGIRLAEHLYQQGISSNPVFYQQFGTALIYLDNHKIELVMTRSESYQPHSRYPQVRFATVLEDTLRRDFTINAMYLRVSDGEILDLSGKGKDDLDNKIIRATGNPQVVFREDPLRILRAIRFAVTLDFMIEPDTLQGIKDSTACLADLSAKAVDTEYRKIFSPLNSAKALELFRKLSLALPHTAPNPTEDTQSRIRGGSEDFVH